MRIGMGPVCASKCQQNDSQPDLFSEREKHHVVRGVFSGNIELSRDPDGTPIVNIEQTVTCHSPDGFEWGYGGSGPADLALNILLRCTDKDTAFRLHQQFKDEFISGLPESGGIIKGFDVSCWVAAHVKD